MIESSEDLRHAIRELGTVDPDPGRVAEQILERLEDAEAHVVAAVTLRDFVRRVLSLPNAPSAVPDSTPEFRMMDGRKTASWKVQATQNQRLQSILNRAVYGLDGEWKHYGDCSEADLLVMVQSRRTKAEELANEADHYEKVVGLLRERDVEKVRDLPDDVLRDLYEPRHAA